MSVEPPSPYGSIDAIARASGLSDTRSLRRALRDLYNLLPSHLRQVEQRLASGEHGIEIGAMFEVLE